MAKPSFAQPATPAEAPFLELPPDLPLDFVGAPEDAGNGGGGVPEDLPVDVGGLPPIEPPLESPVEPPLFVTPPVDIPDAGDLG